MKRVRACVAGRHLVTCNQNQLLPLDGSVQADN